MMKFIGALSCVVLYSLSMPVLGAKQDYKCYINSTKKGEQVVFYRWDEKDARLRAASLPGKQLTDKKGKKYFIKEVEECVPLNQEFSSKRAKAKDKQTLR